MLLLAVLFPGEALFFRAHAAERANPLFGYTHMMPSPFTLDAGRLVYGSSIAVGVTDFFQIGTDVVRNVYGIYNANAKLALWDAEWVAGALTFGVQHARFESASGTQTGMTFLQPGAVVAVAFVKPLAWFLGGNLSFTPDRFSAELFSSRGVLQGAHVQSDVSWEYLPATGKRAVGWVLSAGASYDITYRVYGVGLSHHFPGFHVGIHVYPNAARDRFYPILSGGGSLQL